MQIELEDRIAEIQSAADSVGESVHVFVMKAIDDRLEQIKRDSIRAADGQKVYSLEECMEIIEDLKSDR